MPERTCPQRTIREAIRLLTEANFSDANDTDGSIYTCDELLELIRFFDLASVSNIKVDASYKITEVED